MKLSQINIDISLIDTDFMSLFPLLRSDILYILHICNKLVAWKLNLHDGAKVICFLRLFLHHANIPTIFHANSFQCRVISTNGR